jgi:hypothetical protein
LCLVTGGADQPERRGARRLGVLGAIPSDLESHGPRLRSSSLSRGRL